jgi:hypothetical protein
MALFGRSEVGVRVAPVGRFEHQGNGPMRYLAILDCPVIFSGENSYRMTSIDMCPSAGITAGLISRHVKVVDGRLIAVCIWTSETWCRDFYDSAWYAKASDLWGDQYQLRIEAIDETQAA